MQDKKEVKAVIEKIQDIHKRKDMQVWNKETKHLCITVNIIR